MASPPASQVSLDDILEYTSNNEVLTPAEQAQQLRELEEPIPADLADQLFTPEVPTPAAINPYVGQVPNTHLYAISKAELSSRAGVQYVPLPLPTTAMLEAAARPDISELIPQDHPEWQNLRSGEASAKRCTLTGCHCCIASSPTMSSSCMSRLQLCHYAVGHSKELICTCCWLMQPACAWDCACCCE